MNFTQKTFPKLPDDKIEEIKELFTAFYHHYADTALPGQVDFMDSTNKQFNENQYLSERQVEAIKNIIDSCDEKDEDVYQY
jgi:hypothetical protein